MTIFYSFSTASRFKKNVGLYIPPRHTGAGIGAIVAEVISHLSKISSRSLMRGGQIYGRKDRKRATRNRDETASIDRRPEETENWGTSKAG